MCRTNRKHEECKTKLRKLHKAMFDCSMEFLGHKARLEEVVSKAKPYLAGLLEEVNNQYKTFCDARDSVVEVVAGSNQSEAMGKKMMETMNTGGVLESSKATKISEKVPPAHQPQEKETFQESQTSGLFKLGQIPKDEKGGHHIDAGTTVMNAINSLKPDQIKAMTMDTKQLIETQKSLMGMLQTFQPMVSEGKQMMETFQEMFSPAMGAMKVADGMVSK